MPNTITLTKISDSKIKKSPTNVAIYTSDNGLTMEFTYEDNGYIENCASIRFTKTGKTTEV